MAEFSQDQIISDVARDVVEKIAPQELTLFPITSKVYFERRQRVRTNQEPEDVMVGFGEGVGGAFLTPIVLTVTTEVIKKIFERFWPEKKSEQKPKLSEEQLLHIRQVAVAKVRQFNLSEAQIKSLVDALLVCLVIPSQPDGT